ncbi:MAG: hypothetical protein H2172_12295 [Opitutus sp.]|jgi:hypothetical protein|nr:hypothetical protein [Opitutus sp.]MCS6244624.1 hypothetical protein [Opitutus sp.]MCS6248195.1 hypothetical protein [Opitutus sp.]MCS6274513.1 hypothetical protein [Opitutus sp.]MCS6275939.1 hypothetical protein [Opitutus sp.]
MSFGGSKKPNPTPDTGNVQQNEVATNQQAVAIPLVMGTNKVALRWITPATNQFTKPAPTQRPGKK